MFLVLKNYNFILIMITVNDVFMMIIIYVHKKNYILLLITRTIEQDNEMHCNNRYIFNIRTGCQIILKNRNLIDTKQHDKLVKKILSIFIEKSSFVFKF